MVDWTSNTDILEAIARQIKWYGDFIRFGCVCSSWHTAASEKNFRSRLSDMPWLMLPQQQGTDTRTFYYSNPLGDEFRTLELSEISDHKCLSSKGWLLTNDMNLNMSLFEPFSKTRIELPHMDTFSYYEAAMANLIDMYGICIDKCALSENPLSSCNYIVMVVYGDIGRLAYYKPGFKSWITVPGKRRRFSDIIYHKGRERFYGVQWGGKVVAVDVDNDDAPVATRVADFSNLGVYFGPDKSYLVELEGNLLVLQRRYEDDSDELHDWHVTKSFIVLELDMSTGTWTQVKSLGDYAVFVGRNSSVAVLASRCRCKSNCIYFTDDAEFNCLNDDITGKDIGIYNMENGEIEPYYGKDSCHRVTPPLWIEKTLI